jgi:DNA-binding MarR family transcriptional regulator
MNNTHHANAENPGFLIRRLQQISSSIFMSRLRSFRLTPIQYTILRVVKENAGIDQRSIATFAALDTSTTTDVLTRLAARKLVSRAPGRTDRRTRVVRLTKTGERLLRTAMPYVHAAQQELLAPLSPSRRKALIEALLDLLDARERADSEGLKIGPWRRFR